MKPAGNPDSSQRVDVRSNTDLPNVDLARAWFPPFVIAGALFLVALSINLQIPLYATYALIEGYGAGVGTLVFASYAFVVIPVLVGLGSLSDRFGRKPVMIIALSAAIAAAAVVIILPAFLTLLFARVFHGLAIGLSAGAATAYLTETMPIEDSPRWAATVVTATTSLGFGLGPLVTSLTLANGGEVAAPFSLWIYVVAALPFLLGLILLRNVKPAVRGPLVQLPYLPREGLPFVLSIFAAWAVSGTILAVLPRVLAAHDLLTWSGLAILLVNVSGISCQPSARRMASRRAVGVGLVLAIGGFVATAFGAAIGHVPVLLIGAVAAGASCYGLVYLGGLAAVSEAAGGARASAASAYFLAGYLGLSLPVIGLGFLADAIGTKAALLVFGGAVLVLCGASALLVRQGHSVGSKRP